MKRVHILRNKGYTIRADEEAIKTKLTEMSNLVQKPTVFKGRINELSAQLQQFIERDRSGVKYSISDEKALAAIYQVHVIEITYSKALSDTQTGLQYLLETSDADTKDLESLKKGYASLVK
jgi:nuclear pore complex protein Nup54